MKVFIIGTGNVATALGRAVQKSGHQLTGVLGRDPAKASGLAKKLNCIFFTSANKIPVSSDVYLIAIKDDAIADVIKDLPPVKGIVAHTSGASPMNLLDKFANRGVCYPVETITMRNPRSFKKVPVCVEGSDEKTFRKLMLLANSISNEIYALDSHQRATLHVAAVFANNFTNYLFGIAADILNRDHLPASLLKTLAQSTVSNAFEKGSYNSQTGPAVRNDTKTINRHLKLLDNNKEYQKLYSLITSQIKSVHNKERQ
jgi:predicted short-subunit dehydrogenase-like oxidoreductase (DUF2520 family)